MWVRSPTAKNDGRKSAIVKEIDEFVNHSRYLGAAGCDFAGAAEVVAGVVVAVGVTEGHPSIVAYRRHSRSRVQGEESHEAVLVAAVLEVEDGRTEWVQAGSGQEQERAEVVHTD